MKGYIVKRILSLIPVLFVVSVMVFLIIHITPGDPAAVILGSEATPDEVEELRESLGLNEPLIIQYFAWIGGIVKGDLGFSIFMDQPVTNLIFEYIQPTMSLALLALALAIIISIPFGIQAAKKQGTMVDQSFMGATLLGLSIPNFLLGLFLIIIFAVQLNWLPASGYKSLSAGVGEHIKYLIMPAIALGAALTAQIARMTRASMVEVLNLNYIKTAKAKGLTDQKVVYKHALRNAFIPVLTVIGQTIGILIAGAVVTEAVFNIPGIGTLIINSIERRDYQVVQGTVLFITVVYVFINLIVDLLYGVIDPRVRYDK